MKTVADFFFVLCKAEYIDSVTVIISHWNYAPIRIATLTHWGRVTHICVNKLTNIGSDNGLSPGRRQAIIWTNAGILLIGPLGTNFSEIAIKIHIFLFKKMYLKMSSGEWRPFCLGLNVLTLSLWKNQFPIHIMLKSPIESNIFRVLEGLSKDCISSPRTDYPTHSSNE